VLFQELKQRLLYALLPEHQLALNRPDVEASATSIHGAENVPSAEGVTFSQKLSGNRAFRNQSVPRLSLATWPLFDRMSQFLDKYYVDTHSRCAEKYR